MNDMVITVGFEQLKKMSDCFQIMTKFRKIFQVY